MQRSQSSSKSSRVSVACFLYCARLVQVLQLSFMSLLMTFLFCDGDVEHDSCAYRHVMVWWQLLSALLLSLTTPSCHARPFCPSCRNFASTGNANSRDTIAAVLTKEGYASILCLSYTATLHDTFVLWRIAKHDCKCPTCLVRRCLYLHKLCGCKTGSNPLSITGSPVAGTYSDLQ